MTSIAQGYYTIAVWITRFAYLNILWVAFTILGLGIFGLMPATVAMFAVVRKWNMGEQDITIFPMFWKTFRQEFVKSNGLGLLLVAIGYLLTIEFQILGTQTSLIYQMVQFSVVVILILYVMVVAFFFPIYVHFNLKSMDYIKWPFIIGIIHPILTVVLLVGIGLLLSITFYSLPALLFLFGGSVTAYILMWGVSKTFAKYEVQNK
ncbi:YesL family protein [Oceanobacillus kimchii]|uniref:YesL family protein n=1 Tax=Oceanobacillus kimchii TaxID=746691 RepID=UPI0021A35320|nr:YesL family protein [Oceanobacillus kimchii]MCT1576867.1 YesL family protein [Oceanobacillus kimchii]MCT2134937.1 YesL family protein [Oceanobacillus kimchii]